MVKHKTFETEDEAINSTKKDIEYSCGGYDRKWFEASPPSSYNDDTYLVKIFVLEGSPPRGIILLDRANKKVLGYDITGKVIASHRIDKYKKERGYL